MAEKKYKFFKFRIPISLQISVFMVIIAFVPVVAMMALHTYEKQQLAMLESSNVQQARLVSASLSSFGFTKENAENILQNMNGEFVSRIRILDSKGELLADSAYLKKDKAIAGIEVETNASGLTVSRVEKNTSADETFIYRMFSFPVRLIRKILGRPTAYQNADYYSTKKFYDGEEIKTALNGKYGAVTRISSGEQKSVSLYSAVPIKDKNLNVCGVVLVNSSTYRILRNIYELRRDLAVIFIKSLAVVIIIAVFFIFRISRPLNKLSKQACVCADKKGRIVFTEFAGRKRIDEIGELSRSFSNLIERLNKRIQFSQAFSSDISHEFKNPLTVIRSSAELLNDENLSIDERSELANTVVQEVSHLQKLLSGVRNISKIDAGEEIDFDLINVEEYIQNLVARIKARYSAVKNIDFSFENQMPENFKLPIPEDYFDRMAENLIDNAASFADKISVKIRVLSFDELDCEYKLKYSLNPVGNYFFFSVEDNGPGINSQSWDKIFDRFYSERGDEEKSSHTGLGLSIVKSIVDSLEGDIKVKKSKSLGGAGFDIIFKIKTRF